MRSRFKLIVKSVSEWYQPDDSTSSIAKYYKTFIEAEDSSKVAKELAQHELDRVLALEWMNEAMGKGLDVSERVWHMSPLAVMDLKQPSLDNPKYSEEFKIMVSTIYGEAANSSSVAWRTIAFVIMNRVGVREWKKYKDVSGVIKNTGFDAYSHNTTLYKNAMNYLNGKESQANRKIVDNIASEIYSIYLGKEEDFTDNSILYYSPNVQKTLHAEKPNMYAEKPNWDFDVLEEVEIQGISENDDFKFYKYK